MNPQLRPEDLLATPRQRALLKLLIDAGVTEQVADDTGRPLKHRQPVGFTLMLDTLLASSPTEEHLIDVLTWDNRVDAGDVRSLARRVLALAKRGDPNVPNPADRLTFHLPILPQLQELSERYGPSYEALFHLMDNAHLLQGFRTLEHLHEKIKKLLAGVQIVPLSNIYDHGTTRWYLYFLGPSLRAVAAEGWVAKHASDIALLAQSNALTTPERQTVVECFGLEEFHLMVAATPCSDDLVKKIHYFVGSASEMLMRMAGRVCAYRWCDGTYPPPAHTSDPDRVRCTSAHYNVLRVLSDQD